MGLCSPQTSPNPNNRHLLLGAQSQPSSPLPLAGGKRQCAHPAFTKLREPYDATRFDFYSPEEVWALVRAVASEQDGASFLTAAFTGLRRGS